jgi:Na+/H+ antiporter NhaD/arsenite permease-like protein
MIPGIIAWFIFIISLFLIFSEKLNRFIAAVAGAASMLVAGRIFGYYTEKQAFESIDIETIGLLLGMMILVALLEPTGFFQYLAVLAGRFSKGKPLRLLILLGSITTMLSMFLDNITTVVLIAPVTILICEILGMNPSPLLISEALLSNTGGVATLVGDPPNVLIASASGLTFNDFMTHSFPLIAVVWIVTLILLRYLFRKELALVPENIESILCLDPAAALDDKRTAQRVLIVLGFAILMFFLQTPLGISPAFIAILAASTALIWVRPDVRKTLEKIEWSVLGFFIALFILVGGLESAGALQFFAELVAQMGNINPIVFGVCLLWLVAGLSAIVDNIPITIALIPVIQGLGASGMNITPLWWSLAFGAGLGGNGTIIGSTANVVVSTLSEHTRTPITSALWNKRGLPVMLTTLVITTILYIVAYRYFLE